MNMYIYHIHVPYSFHYQVYFLASRLREEVWVAVRGTEHKNKIQRHRNIKHYVTVHAKRWYKSANIFFEITLDFAFIDPSTSLQTCKVFAHNAILRIHVRYTFWPTPPRLFSHRMMSNVAIRRLTSKPMIVSASR